jgi:hypothetical protein
MNDRELLELAAKAAGYDGLGSWDERVNAMWDGEGWHWNPLTDDGDALRLAVKLGLILDCKYQSAMPHDRQGVGEDWLDGDGKDDPYAATRRAIVRAAADIAKQQEQPR